MAKKKKRAFFISESYHKSPEKLPDSIKNSEETYQISKRRIDGIQKPAPKSYSSRHLYEDGGMAFDRFEYGLD